MFIRLSAITPKPTQRCMPRSPLSRQRLSVAALQHADAPFTAGPPFLPVTKPGFLLFPLPFVALGAAIGNADALDSLFVRRLFIAGGVEGRVACDQARDASQLLLMRLDSRN